ncbi:hypothetical protein [Nostoc sp. UIC 10630]|uniref:hypothetical protein n=1 Tax=Nostoc sp. UIC 10630 TaxID=2100146 RepID=UPI0013D81B72|nr:hypothetical protein [Nostoc sp. UIC 10630]NEU84106.1 hypothetical protein [Nostoc sp. UIC 10630]
MLNSLTQLHSIAKERLRLQEERLRYKQQLPEDKLKQEKQKEEHLKFERQKKERSKNEQKLQTENYRPQQQKQINPYSTNNNSWSTRNFWSNNSSNGSSEKVYVQGYRCKDGTWVEGYWRSNK